MSDESITGRITPYEIVFGMSGFAGREFPVIAEEAQRVGADELRRDQFASLESVGAALAQLVPEGAEPAALDHFLAILFHGFRFWKAGQPVYAFETPVLRSLIDSPPALAEWKPVTPGPSFYAEMPQNLFWAAVSEEQPPEPLEGFFVDVSPAGQRLEAEVSLVLGMRPDRPGFGVVGTTIDLDRMRAVNEPDAFASEIPGADLAGLCSLQRTSEIGILLMRSLWYIDAYAESLERVNAAVSRQRTDLRVMPTSLGYHRVSLGAQENRG
jgi:hypothetical protein